MAVSNVSSSSSSSSIYGNRNVISGLASGMDTESMIENMVMGIKNKIDTQKQNQQILLWQQEAYRSISDQLVQISNKYTSYTSSTNLMSSAFFQPSIITSLGKNADMISASGSTNSDIQISKVENLAKTETVSFSGLNGVTNADSINGTKTVDLKGDVQVSNFAGQQMSFEYGNKTFTITFDSDREYNSLDDVADEINKQLGNASITLSDGSSIKMNSKIKASVSADNKLELSFVDGTKETNTLELKGYSSKSVLEALNLSGGSKITGDEVLASSQAVDDAKDLTTTKSAGEVLAGATMNVTYNGTTVAIKMPAEGTDEYKAIFGEGVTDAGEQMQKYLQTQFDQAFGYNRITVKGGSGNDFKPEFVLNSSSDTLSINSGTLNVVGKGGIFGIDRGASNRVNTGKTLGDLFGTVDEVQADGSKITKIARQYFEPVGTDDNGNATYALEINGVRIGEEYTADTTLETILSDINSNEKAGVKVSYSSTANQFVFTSKHGGEGGKIEIGNDLTNGAGGTNLAASLFGSVTYDKSQDGKLTGFTVVRDGETAKFNADGEVTEVNGTPASDKNVSSVNIIKGQDAQMEAYINGVKTTLTSGTNTFDIDGFKVTANGTFEATNESERVTFDKKVDADKIVDAVKSFVEDYNKVLAEINEQYSTQPDHKNEYKPLTDDQKADMTEKQIEEYETKAKEGLLFGDNDLGGLSNGLRFVFSNLDLDAIGVSVSTSYSDKGKITLDETKLRSALASDPDAVAEAFTAPLEQKQVTNSDGTTSWVDDTSSGGAMSRLKVQLDKYAATTGATKGILIEKAGSQYSPMALLQNTLQDKIDSYDDVIDTLTDQLNDKIDFYTSKFSKLEALIAQMNSQSSYLMSMGGSSY
ncbi:flagellar filament capping protein FliD [Agathobaculum sp. Marseille-P7918]|uniref:flagellar filament capping protein FliD n=1 Tax=Agathobaculum sp. Marseille-P7918 TaxID=2479843 RepID=UPI00356303F2